MYKCFHLMSTVLYRAALIINRNRTRSLTFRSKLEYLKPFEPANNFR